MNRIKKAELKAYKLLDELNVDTPPVPVELIARKLNIQVVYEPLKGDLSGLLYRDVNSTIIGVNQRHSEQRQRFTIAHEIGHFLMHEGDSVHVDEHDKFRVNFRDERSSQARDMNEIEANAFAAALLMPEELLKDVFYKEFEQGIDLSSDTDGMDKISKRFDVSQQALLIRIGRLGLLDMTI